MSDQRTSKIRHGRLARLGRMGRLAGGLAGGAVAEGFRQWSKGHRPGMRELVMTPGNAGRLGDELARLRGAAMKVGQLISMDAGHLMPPELSDILGRLRSEADSMPASQVQAVMAEALSDHWQERFQEFDHRPMASASIGQVHRAVLLDGTRVAVKIQYPGVARSIDSDVDNVATLLRWSRLLPEELDIEPLLTEAKHQLNLEADYLQEAAFVRAFAESLVDSDAFMVPEVYGDLTTHNVLTMRFMTGAPIERQTGRPAAVRNELVSSLLHLFLRELFEFRLVQTDPNFANYLYDHGSRRVLLLDFGATRLYRTDTVEGYRRLLTGAIYGDRSEIATGAHGIGYFSGDIEPEQREEVLTLFEMATEPLRVDGNYDFGQSDIAERLRAQGLKLSMEHGYWHAPPVDALFLHRKLAGLYLLARRLDATVDMRPLRARILGESATPSRNFTT